MFSNSKQTEAKQMMNEKLLVFTYLYKAISQVRISKGGVAI